VLLQAALNGDLTRDAHPAVPISPDELAREATAAVAAGARAIHMHPRDRDGRETFEKRVVDATVRQVRAACEVPVGVSTGAWIEPDLERRVACIRQWREPDYASVNLSEEGAEQVMEALAEAGIPIEAAVWNASEVERLAASPDKGAVLRILVEPLQLAPEEALDRVRPIHEALERTGLGHIPRLQHGADEATWVLIEHAAREGFDTRIGLEDALAGPSGEPVEGNAQLVAAAREILDRYGDAP
jgi:uncharacterized protein (DUF849 family)